MKKIILAATAAALAVSLGACTTNETQPETVTVTETAEATTQTKAQDSATPTTTQAAPTPDTTHAESTPTTQAESTPDTSTDLSAHPEVEKVTNALTNIGAEWTPPTSEGDNPLILATDTYDLTINGYDAGVNIFLNEEALTEWLDTVAMFDGIAVTYGNVAVSLNSGLGRADSLELAPKLAAELGGIVTGGEADETETESATVTTDDEPQNSDPHLEEFTECSDSYGDDYETTNDACTHPTY